MTNSTPTHSSARQQECHLSSKQHDDNSVISHLASSPSPHPQQVTSQQANMPISQQSTITPAQQESMTLSTNTQLSDNICLQEHHHSGSTPSLLHTRLSSPHHARVHRQSTITVASSPSLLHTVRLSHPRLLFLVISLPHSTVCLTTSVSLILVSSGITPSLLHSLSLSLMSITWGLSSSPPWLSSLTPLASLSLP